jgi:hypothetical protein
VARGIRLKGRRERDGDAVAGAPGRRAAWEARGHVRILHWTSGATAAVW